MLLWNIVAIHPAPMSVLTGLSAGLYAYGLVGSLT